MPLNERGSSERAANAALRDVELSALSDAELSAFLGEDEQATTPTPITNNTSFADVRSEESFLNNVQVSLGMG